MTTSPARRNRSRPEHKGRVTTPPPPPVVGPVMDPQAALNVLVAATGDPSLKLNRQDTHTVEQALATLQNLIAPTGPPPGLEIEPEGE